MLSWKKKFRVMRHYDQSARVYDAQYNEEQEAKIKTVIEGLTLAEDNVVLDAGCGTGLLFDHVAEKSKSLIGADISRGILKEGKKRAKNHRNVALVLADADHMPFSDHSFDIVFAITLMQNMPNPQQTLEEMKRVGKSNAAFAVSGLRKAFTQEGFESMLKSADLRVAFLKLDPRMREYICICFKARR